ncbi:DUF5914 domain-containing protein [Pseudonocardia sp. KRD291]|uniref:DUF5914 domain-containing protein n=1 Tax=Pseudonocardia sp. KRD291 TaxID=2792007 RepID=UPI0027E28B20|nr:DUF5914 domain-containing protein [Pseudonocardia sp. KRD291]
MRRTAHRRPLALQRIDPRKWAEQRPTYRQADPALIAAATERATARPAGNWFVLAAGAELRIERPVSRTIAGTEIVAWRDRDGTVTAGPGACPHLGAPLADGYVEDGRLRCRWHGLPVTRDGGPGWCPLPSFDDGVLVWVRLDRAGAEDPLPEPVLPLRPGPQRRIAAVSSVTGVCEPVDIVANRLDPWHGAWFHPYSFARLTVVEAPPVTGATEETDRFVVDTTFRIGPRLGVPVRAEFFCPDRRTVVMRITDGEGQGSVVETHAVPHGPGPDGRARTTVTEAVIATSDRPGFGRATRCAALLRPAMRAGAARLWRDDIAFAERRYAVRR